MDSEEIQELKKVNCRLKDRIAHLEELLWTLENGDPDEYRSVRDLVRRTIGLHDEKYLDLGFGVR
jgi:hypothetical protein